LCERLSRTDENLPLLPLKNEFEYKHVKLPVRPLNVKFNIYQSVVDFSLAFQRKNFSEKITITLGIGKLIEAEVLLRKVLPKHCEFFGVDPSALYNKALVESYNGTFFEAAIGDKTEVKNALILTDKGYKFLRIKHVALEEFLTNTVGK
uniref:Methyltransf_13 domain-containing protein n=1 Tax=Enterobius vermicularis TaxID=51028 RepID=A0A0N4VNQ4_ENTVE